MSVTYLLHDQEGKVISKPGTAFKVEKGKYLLKAYSQTASEDIYNFEVKFRSEFDELEVDLFLQTKDT